MTAVDYEDPLYGTVEFTGAAARLVDHPALQRLEDVHQNGGAFLTNPDMDTSRLAHSLGVAALCERLGASEAEVIAALVHDVGHTAFSHVVDHALEKETQTFHEDEVDRIVARYDLDAWIDRAGFDPATVLDPDRFPILERPLPGLCADRLDYQLRDVYTYGLIDRETVDDIIAGVTIEDGRPVAADTDTARKLVDVSLLLQRQVFFDARHEAANLVLADLIGAALDRAVLTIGDLFGTDSEVLVALREDPELAATLDALGPDLSIHRGAARPNYSISRKRRTVDPIVAGTGQRITDLDPTVAREVSRFSESVPLEQSYRIEFGN